MSLLIRKDVYTVRVVHQIQIYLRLVPVKIILSKEPRRRRKLRLLVKDGTYCKSFLHIDHRTLEDRLSRTQFYDPTDLLTG